jgi:hypothetical protein
MLGLRVAREGFADRVTVPRHIPRRAGSRDSDPVQAAERAVHGHRSEVETTDRRSSYVWTRFAFTETHRARPHRSAIARGTGGCRRAVPPTRVIDHEFLSRILPVGEQHLPSSLAIG